MTTPSGHSDIAPWTGVSNVWLNLVERFGIGESVDDPVEFQVCRAAMADRRPHPRRKPDTRVVWWFIDADLNDIDVVNQHLLSLPEVRGKERASTRSLSGIIDRSVARSRKLPAFKGKVITSKVTQPAFVAFKPTGRDQTNGFWPTVRSCPTATATRGILWPYQLTTPSYMNECCMWVFTPDGSERPSRVEMLGHPRRSVASVRR